MNKAKVDIIVPTYNRSDVILRALNSVIQQTYSNWRLWIVDDGSTDSTHQKISKWLNWLPFHQGKQVTYWKTSNRGVSAARNFAIQKSDSEWVAFLDSDDEWIPNKLEVQIKMLQETCLKVIHSNEIWIRNGVRVNPKKIYEKSGRDFFERSLKFCLISPSCTVLHRSVLDQVGLFREDFPVCEDYDLWLRITSQYPVAFVPQALAKKYGGHPDQLSRKYHSMDYYRVLAMASQLRGSILPPDKIEKTAQELIRKSKVLLQGYLKHQNLTHYGEIEQIQKETKKLLYPTKVD